MVEGVEAVGEMVTGGMAARAVEPGAGEGHGHDGKCLNCGAALVGPHCHCCGQAGHVHRTLTAWWHDLAHGVLHLDGKIWRTLPLLAWKPGELTRRYVEGERAKFVSPMALFLFSVFTMFAVVSLLGAPVHLGDGSSDQSPQEERAEAQREFDEERAENLAELRALQAERQQLVAAGEPTTSADVDIRNLENEIALEDRLFKQAIALIDAEAQRDAAQARGESGAPVNAASDLPDGSPVVISGADSLNGWFADAYKKAKENPSLLLYKLQSNAYKFSWALIPISVPFLWLLFLHRRRYRQFRAYDHTVFVTYSIAFMSLGFIVLMLLSAAGLPASWVALAVTFIPPFHMYRQLRGAYSLSRFSALWRTFALTIFAFLAASLFLTLVLTIGVSG